MPKDFREQIAHLCDLRDIDVNIHRIEQEIRALPGSIEGERVTYESLKVELDALLGELTETEKAKRHDEMELEVTSARVKEREAKLYAIKTNQEYQAAVKELADAKKLNREREDRILQHMERLEFLTQKKTQLEPTCSDKGAAYQQKLAEIQKKEEELQKKISEIEARRQAVAVKIDQQLMRKYDFIRKKFANALVSVQRGTCGGCHMHIPPQLFNEIQRYTEIKGCPSCQRLLYIDPRPAEEKESAL